MRMGSLIRATVLRGYPDLVRELGGDPELLLARFGIPSGVEFQEDAFIPIDAF
ncbi:MAG: AraC family transcriptional regulator, partial [Mycobacterium sp.]